MMLTEKSENVVYIGNTSRSPVIQKVIAGEVLGEMYFSDAPPTTPRITAAHLAIGDVEEDMSDIFILPSPVLEPTHLTHANKNAIILWDSDHRTSLPVTPVPVEAGATPQLKTNDVGTFRKNLITCDRGRLQPPREEYKSIITPDRHLYKNASSVVGSSNRSQDEEPERRGMIRELFKLCMLCG